MWNSLSPVSSIEYKLEQKYKDAGLEFMIPFHGYVPVQAYGYLGLKRFYFRERGGKTSLLVGECSRDFLSRDAYPDLHTFKSSGIVDNISVEKQFSMLLDEILSDINNK